MFILLAKKFKYLQKENQQHLFNSNINAKESEDTYKDIISMKEYISPNLNSNSPDLIEKENSVKSNDTDSALNYIDLFASYDCAKDTIKNSRGDKSKLEKIHFETKNNKIIVSNETDEDKIVPFDCIDNNGSKCKILAITRKKENNRMQFYINYSEVKFVYNIYE